MFAIGHKTTGGLFIGELIRLSIRPENIKKRVNTLIYEAGYQIVHAISITLFLFSSKVY